MLKDHRQALAALQEQLLALKAQLGDAIKLRKGTGDDAPFPLHLLVTVAAPAAAASYDLSQLVLDVVISKQLFSSPEGALTVSVQQRDLPAALAPHISQQLQQGLVPLTHEVGPAIQQLPQAVGQLLRTVQQQFVQLISSLPHLIEPYESVDAAGATVRRYALVDSSEPSGTQPEEPSSEPSSTAAAAGTGDSGSAAAAAAGSGAGSSDAPSAAAPAAAAAGAHPPPIKQHSHAAPAAGKQEVTKEHGSKPVAAAAAAPEGDAEAAASVPPSSSNGEALATSGQLRHLSQSPKDPAAFATSSSQNNSSTSVSRLRPLHPGRPPVRPNAAIPGLPPEAAAAQDIAALVRRYGAAFQLKAASAADTMYAVSSSRGRGSRRAGSVQWTPPQAAAAAAAGGVGGGASSSGVGSRGPTAHSDAWLYKQLSLGSVHRFSLMLVPTDPDWAPRGPCHITGRVEADKYPQPGCCQLQVHPNTTLAAAEAQQLQRQLQQQLQAAWGRPSLLLGVVRWAENYAAAGLQPKGPPQQQQQRRGAAREGSLQLPSAAERQQALRAASSSRNHSRSSSPCSSYSDGEYGSGSSSDAGGQAPRPGGSASSNNEGPYGSAAAEAGVGFQAEDAGAAAGSGPGGFALQLEGLQLDNIGVLQVHTAQLQVQCTRCSSSVTVSLCAAGAAVTQGTSSAAGRSAAAASSSGSSQGFQWAAPCATCQQQQVLQLRPKMVHEMNNTLASCRVAGCRPVDLLPSLMAAQCAECSAVTSLRGVQVGRPASRNCPHCHRQLSLVISYVSIVPRGPPGAGAGGRGAGAGRAGGDGGRDGRQKGSGQERLVPGQPLPDYGTCKHYRHSHRWLRFPCCGRRFACDLCHEEGVEDGHPVAWANRMVCGYCSREQAVAAVCAHCGKKLASSASNPSGRNTRFWEGGQGCRDIRRLNRNDPHKHAGRGKTRSAKGSRVGPKAWSGTTGGTQQRSD